MCNVVSHMANMVLSRYKSSTIGWSSREKVAEMKEQGLIYILIKSKATEELRKNNANTEKSQETVGFASFMTTWENEEPVIYCYELQLPKSLRGLGVGKTILCIIESVGIALGMPKCMLTVFSANPAYEFYKRRG